jgi:prepilin-type N-terminal cleavage/methylation domain-containing protein
MRTVHGQRNATHPSGFETGFTLIELLVTVVIFSLLGLSIVHFFGSQMKFRDDTDVRAETHQGLSAAFDSLTRDIRLAGACLPTTPFFVPMAGVNATVGGVARDSITLRTGVISATTVCVQATLTAAVNAGDTILNVDNLAGFKVGGWAYVVGTVPGEIFRVSALSGASGPGTVTAATALTQNYPATGGVYGFEERTYAIDTANYGAPTLTLDVDRQAATAGVPATPIAAGINSLNIRYRLTTNCPPGGLACSMSDLPANNATWLLVNQVEVTMNAQSLKTLATGPPGGRFTETATVTIQPRNIVTFRTG